MQYNARVYLYVRDKSLTNYESNYENSFFIYINLVKNTNTYIFLYFFCMTFVFLLRYDKYVKCNINKL